MAFVHGREAQVYFGGYNLTPYLSAANSSALADLVEASPFLSTVKGWVAGLADAKFTASGFFDGSAAAVDEILAAAVAGAGRELTHIIGGRARSMTAVETNYEVSTPADGVAAVSFEAQAITGPEISTVPHALGAETADGEDAASIDGGASSANGWSAFLHVTAVAGTSTPTLTARVQDSADNSTFADVTGGAFAAKTAIGSERIVSAAGATLRRYVRTGRVITGTTPSFTYAIAVSRK